MGTDFLIQLIVYQAMFCILHNLVMELLDAQVEKGISVLFRVSVHPAVIIRFGFNESLPTLFCIFDFIAFFYIF